MLVDSARTKSRRRLMFHAHLVAAVGGMLYRFDPTTLAFQPKPGAFYFPSAIEIADFRGICLRWQSRRSCSR